MWCATTRKAGEEGDGTGGDARASPLVSPRKMSIPGEIGGRGCQAAAAAEHRRPPLGPGARESLPSRQPVASSMRRRRRSPLLSVPRRCGGLSFGRRGGLHDDDGGMRASPSGERSPPPRPTPRDSQSRQVLPAGPRTNVAAGGPAAAMCVRDVDDLHCNSHHLTRQAALFIDARAE